VHGFVSAPPANGGVKDSSFAVWTNHHWGKISNCKCGGEESCRQGRALRYLRCQNIDARTRVGGMSSNYKSANPSGRKHKCLTVAWGKKKIARPRAPEEPKSSAPKNSGHVVRFKVIPAELFGFASLVNWPLRSVTPIRMDAANPANRTWCSKCGIFRDSEGFETKGSGQRKKLCNRRGKKES
jgi:hypothetical protein